MANNRNKVGREAAKGGKSSLLERLRRRVGDAGEVIDHGIAWAERQAKQTADMDVPLLSSAAKMLQPAYVGARAAVANMTSGGGRYYQPEVRDERYFSRDELASIEGNLAKHGGRGTSRYDFEGDLATRVATSQALGGSSVVDGKVTDRFDVDTKDPYGLSSGLHEAAESFAERGSVGKGIVVGTLANLVDMGHTALGAVFGNENDPDAGKVRTEIPLDRLRRMDAKGGETPGSATAVSETPVSEAPQNPGGPRIVLNPQVFNDKRDALCVAFNEAFRVVMEMNGFEPVSEPTGAQRKFFSDTAYADDELQLRRTILARIATLDTSVKDPTDEQLEETAEMLEMVMEVGAPQNEWEQAAVKRLHDVVVKSLESTRANGSGTPAPEAALPGEEATPAEEVPPTEGPANMV